MDRNDPLLSHQYEAVSALASNFNKVVVITGRVGDFEINPKVQVVSTRWRSGYRWQNLVRFYVVSLPILIRGNFSSVFFHMTDLQCALVAPFIWLRRKKQLLWYAHTYRSKYLTFSSLWVTKVVTSTSGSCPLPPQKVEAIGQAIDETIFFPLNSNSLDFSKLIHIGRFDKSKNIQLLIDAARKLKETFPDVRLTLVGSPANAESRDWAEALKLESLSDVLSGWLIFKESIPRSGFPNEISQNGCFFHGYTGSLDKTLIETTMLRAPVVTLNPEYLEIFGAWGTTRDLNLFTEYVAMRSMSRESLENELDRRLSIARSHHSLRHWVEELTRLLV